MATENLSYVEKEKQYQVEYYQKNRAKKIAYAKEQRALKKDEINRRRREKARLNGVKERTKVSFDASGLTTKEYNKRYHLEVASEKKLIEKYQALKKVSKTGAVECGCCKESDIRVLTINHINGNGRSEHKEFGLLRKRINEGLRAIDDLEVLCFNCNIRYEYIRGRSRLPSNWEEVLEKLKLE